MSDDFKFLKLGGQIHGVPPTPSCTCQGGWKCPTCVDATNQRIAELEADLYAQSLAKHQAFETIRAWEVKWQAAEAKLLKEKEND